MKYFLWTSLAIYFLCILSSIFTDKGHSRAESISLVINCGMFCWAAALLVGMS